MPEGDRELLRAAAPHSLRVVRAERHEFQQDMVKLLRNAFADIETVRRESVRVNEERVEEAAAKRERTAKEQAAVEATVDDKKAANVAQSKALKEAQDAVAGATAHLVAERAKLCESQAAREERAARAVEMRRIMAEVWQPLRDASFAGKEWRQRDKVIEVLMRSLGEGLPVSLERALPVALRKKSGEGHGPFAQKAVEAGEVALQVRMDTLTEELAAAEAQVAKQAEAIAAAEAAEAAASEAAAVAMEASIAADNEQLAAGEVLRGLRERLPELDAEATEAALELEAARQRLSQFLELAARFARLEEGTPAAPQAAAGA